MKEPSIFSDTSFNDSIITKINVISTFILYNIILRFKFLYHYINYIFYINVIDVLDDCCIIIIFIMFILSMFNELSNFF